MSLDDVPVTCADSCSFCSHHNAATDEQRSEWLLIRDILHALLAPIVELFDKSTSVAERATRGSNMEDLEHAYTNNARMAFVWLQCFIEREKRWCLTLGCPACNVEHTLDSEFSIRLLYTACLLSELECPIDVTGPTLPSLKFFLRYLHRALDRDVLYGPGYFRSVHDKAVQLHDGIEDLIQQTSSLDAVLSAPSSPDEVFDSSDRLQVSSFLASMRDVPKTRVKRSRLAKRQAALEREEAMWLQDLLDRAKVQPQDRTHLQGVPVSS